MTTNKKLLENHLEKKIKARKHRNLEILAKLRKRNVALKNDDSEDEGINLDLLQRKLDATIDRSVPLRVLRYSKNHRYLTRSKKYNAPKITSGPKVQYELLKIKTNRRFRSEVRMGKQAFRMLYKAIKDHPDYRYKGTGRRPIPCEVQMMIALNRLGTAGVTYMALAERYSVSGNVYTQSTLILTYLRCN